MSEISKNINPRVDVEPLSEGDVWKERHRVQCVINGAQKNHIASLESRLAEAERERDDARELIGKAKEAFGSIAEYWNRDNNEKAMEDACWHSINTAEEALALLSKGKEK